MGYEHPGQVAWRLYRQAGGGTVHYDAERYRDLLVRAGVLAPDGDTAPSGTADVQIPDRIVRRMRILYAP